MTPKTFVHPNCNTHGYQKMQKLMLISNPLKKVTKKLTRKFFLTKKLQRVWSFLLCFAIAYISTFANFKAKIRRGEDPFCQKNSKLLFSSVTILAGLHAALYITVRSYRCR
jgi:hypothetical protein